MAAFKWFRIVLVLSAAILGCEDNSPQPVPAPRYISSFGTWGNDDGEMEYPYGIAIGPDSLLYIGDTGNRRVDVFSKNGAFVRQWPTEEAPWTIVAAPDSTIYVNLHPSHNRPFGPGIRRYTPDGQPLETFNFVNVVGGMEVDQSGNFYVCGLRVYGPDPLHQFVDGPYFWKFNSQWQLVKKWGYPGAQDTTGWFARGMTWNPKGNLVAFGQIGSATAVFEFTPDGQSVSARQIPYLELDKLEDITCDLSGRLLISDPYTELVYMLDSRGSFLNQWNETNENHEPLKRPAGLAVDANGLLYVVDFGRYEIVKFDLSH